MNSISQKAFLSSLTRTKPHRTPVWFMRQAGRYLPEYREVRKNVPDFLSLCYNPKLATEVTLQPLRRFDLDASILFSDILVVPDALGMDVRFMKGEGPVLEPISETAIPQLDENRFSTHLAPVYDTVSSIKKQLPEHITLIGFSGSPWTLASYSVEGTTSRDFPKAREFAYRYTEKFIEWINILADAVILHCRNQIEAGAEVIQLFDSWAGILPEHEYDKWVIEPTKNIVAALKKSHPHIPVIGFPKGSGFLYEKYIKQTKVDAVSVDTTVPLSQMIALKRLCTVQGNLDPMVLATNEALMLQRTRHILEEHHESSSQGQFIFNLGHGILPMTPISHVEALINEIRHFDSKH